MNKNRYISIALFFLLFVSFTNNNVSAQEKKAFLLQRFEGVKEFITKNSTKEELNDIKHNLGRQGVFFSYTNLKYNSNKEITSISIKLKNKKSEFSGEWNQRGLPIPTIKIGEVNGALTATLSSTSEFEIIEEKPNKITAKSSKKTLPIYVVDGKITSNITVKEMDTKNIESISVLKGESAIKKYGERGKNGVIEITTKKK